MITTPRAFAIVIAVLIAASRPVLADEGPTARHLLAGVRAFRDGRYEAALVELRVVQHAADAPDDLAFYLGPTLYKLGRYGEAVDVFVTSHAPRDALTELYLGEAYYQLALYRKARAVLGPLRGMGPVIDDVAARYVAAVDTAYAVPPSEQTIDAYVARGRELAATDPMLAAEYLDEARQVEALAIARHRHDEIIVALAAAWLSAGRTSAAIEVLAGEPALSDEGRWQLARAYAASRDVAHERALLEPLATGHGPHAAEARDLLHKLAP